MQLYRMLKSMGVPIPPEIQKAYDDALKSMTPEQEKHEEDEKFAEQLLEQLLIRYEDPKKYIDIVMMMGQRVIEVMMTGPMTIDTMGPLAKSLSITAAYVLWNYESNKVSKNLLGMISNMTEYIYKNNPELEPQMRVTKEFVKAQNALFHSKEKGPFGKEKATEESYKD